MMRVFAVARSFATGMIGIFFSFLACRLWIGCYPLRHDQKTY
jgi:hypothetical protein